MFRESMAPITLSCNNTNVSPLSFVTTFWQLILNKNKVILLDEATANIDVINEAKIQKAIAENFEGSTIQMIAHRLNTIMFCDKILVLEKGRLAEFDSQDILKKNPKTPFSCLLLAWRNSFLTSHHNEEFRRKHYIPSYMMILNTMLIICFGGE